MVNRYSRNQAELPFGDKPYKSVPVPQAPLQIIPRSSIPEDAKTRRENVWKLLQDGKWHSTMDINAVDVGGSEGCRRLRELRAQIKRGHLPGKGIEKRKMIDSNQFEYRLNK